MIMTRRIFALAAAAALAACAAFPNAGSAPDWAFETSDLPSDPAVRYGVLDNGMRYAVMANATPSGVASMRLRFDAGSLQEEEDQRGLAHMLEHMAFNGSENVPEGEMIRILERTGLEFGPDTNAYTSVDETVYMLDVPDVSDATLDTAFFLMRETAGNLLIDPEALDRERGVVLSELRVRNTYARRYQEAAQEFHFPGLRFADRSPIGEPDVLENAPAERVRAFYEDYYRPERALLVVVGDVDVDAVEARILSTFADWSGEGAPGEDPDPGAFEPRSLEAGLFIDPEMPTAISLSVAYPAEPFVDTAQDRRDRLVRGLGFAMLNRRLQSIGREADAPFIQASASYSRVYDTVETAGVDVVAEPAFWEEALASVEQELRRSLEFGFTQGELDEQLAGLHATFQARADGAATRRTGGLANALVGTLGADSVFTHPSTDLQRFEAIADEITVADVEEAFQAAWGDADPLIFVGANEDFEGDVAEIATAYVDSRALPVDVGVERENIEFAYEDFGPPGAVVSEDRIEDLGLTRLRFANNVRLNVKPTSFAEDRISVRIRVGGGRLELPGGLRGLESLAESAVITGGLTAHSLDELQSVLAGANVGLSFAVGGDAFQFSALTTPQDFALQMKLFAAYLTEPAYREEALSRYRRSLDIWYDSLDATPGGVRSRDVPRLLRDGDARYGVPDKDDLLARDMEELRAALADAFTDGAVEIGVVGDVTVEEAIAVVGESFGALTARAEAAPSFDAARQVRFPDPTPTPIVLTHAGEHDQALALVYWPTVDDSDVDAVRAIGMAKEILQLRLTDRVREADGATYSPSAFASFSSVNPGYGYVGVSLDIEPDRVDEYFAVIDEIAASIAAGEVTEDELERARAPVLEDIEEALESNGYWMSLVSVAQSQPRYLASHRTQAEDYRGLTVDDLVAAAAEYLRPERAFRIEIVPESEG